MDGMMTIGEFSSRCGLSPKVLRSYAASGVLMPAAVDPTTGYRYYDIAQVQQAETVRLLRRAGVALVDIAGFLADPSTGAIEGWERSMTAEAMGRREALAELRCRLSPMAERTRGATEIEVRPVRDQEELRATFDLLGTQLPERIDSTDRRFDDLTARFPSDCRIMVVATVDGQVVGGALAYREDNGTVGLRIIGVCRAFRHRGIGRRLVERVEAEGRLLGSHTVALGTDDAVGFWYHLGYTPHLLFQWVYDRQLYETEAKAVMGGALAGLQSWRSSFNDVPQLFVELDEPRLDLRQSLAEAGTGYHVGFMMSKRIAG